MLSVNLRQGKLYLNDEIKRSVVAKKPYAALVDKSIVPLKKCSYRSGETPLQSR
jgi:hypothetical protein